MREIRLKVEYVIALLQGKEVILDEGGEPIRITVGGLDIVMSSQEYETTRRQLYKEGYNDGLVDKLKQLEQSHEGKDLSSEQKEND